VKGDPGDAESSLWDEGETAGVMASRVVVASAEHRGAEVTAGHPVDDSIAHPQSPGARHLGEAAGAAGHVQSGADEGASSRR
jgi:hypothetical protein